VFCYTINIYSVATFFRNKNRCIEIPSKKKQGEAPLPSRLNRTGLSRQDTGKKGSVN
jgi:hypothetical protein